jgi:hypothetical protein
MTDLKDGQHAAAPRLRILKYEKVDEAARNEILSAPAAPMRRNQGGTIVLPEREDRFFRRRRVTEENR